MEEEIEEYSFSSTHSSPFAHGLLRDEIMTEVIGDNDDEEEQVQKEEEEQKHDGSPQDEAKLYFEKKEVENFFDCNTGVGQYSFKWQP